MQLHLRIIKEGMIMVSSAIMVDLEGGNTTGGKLMFSSCNKYSTCCGFVNIFNALMNINEY